MKLLCIFLYISKLIPKDIDENDEKTKNTIKTIADKSKK
tara:strand:- start:85 stop:201 length:117 start_codon:yes stop_codon:yes gene_type:complete